MPLTLSDSCARLPSRFHARVTPQPVRAPTLICRNVALATQLGLDPDALTAEILAGNRLPNGSEPVALAYAGHQFGGFVPQLGDGRASLLGQVCAPDGACWDIQLKGSGRTPFSRGGDGRSWVGPVLREYLVSEAMHALGIPTTRALGAALTGEVVYRQQGSLPGAVFARAARSHVRVGTFEYFAARGDGDALRLLLDHVLTHQLPNAPRTATPALDLLAEVARRQARLVARWMAVGFVHGVMNTDNVSVVGDTLDYGPCAFLDTYEANKVFSSIDRWGRYAYDQQPRVAQWNLVALARALMPLIRSDESAVDHAQQLIHDFAEQVDAEARSRMRAKLGLVEERPGDDALVTELMELMERGRADFTLTFRALSSLGNTPSEHDAELGGLSEVPTDAWLLRWRTRVADQDEATRQTRMKGVNPVYIPRNHRIEAVIEAALTGDLAPFHAFLAVLASPFEARPEWAEYEAAPLPAEVVCETFCGT